MNKTEKNLEYKRVGKQIEARVRIVARNIGGEFRISKKGVPYALWMSETGDKRISVSWFEKHKNYRLFYSDVTFPDQDRYDFGEDIHALIAWAKRLQTVPAGSARLN